MGSLLAVPTAQKALQTWQTRVKVLACVAASDLLTQEIEAGACEPPFTERTSEILLPPGVAEAGGIEAVLLGALHRFTHRLAHLRTLFFQQGPSQQEDRNGCFGREERLTLQRVQTEQLLDPLKEQLNSLIANNKNG